MAPDREIYRMTEREFIAAHWSRFCRTKGKRNIEGVHSCDDISIWPLRKEEQRNGRLTAPHSVILSRIFRDFVQSSRFYVGPSKPASEPVQLADGAADQCLVPGVMAKSYIDPATGYDRRDASLEAQSAYVAACTAILSGRSPPKPKPATPYAEKAEWYDRMAACSPDPDAWAKMKADALASEAVTPPAWQIEADKRLAERMAAKPSAQMDMFS
jgi:hypothetical protein